MNNNGRNNPESYPDPVSGSESDTGKKISREPNPLFLEIGHRIKKARTAAHITQEQLAEEILVSSKQYISDLERGMVGASIPTIIKICNALNTSADYILLGAGPENRNSLFDQKIGKLSPTQQSLVVDSFMNLYDELQKEHQKKQE